MSSADRAARERGETIRAKLREQLQSGPRTAAELLPDIDVENLSLSEVEFQLGRLEDAGDVIDEAGVYRL